MNYTACCNHGYIKGYSPIRHDGYCLCCGFHPKIGELKVKIEILSQVMLNIGNQIKDFNNEDSDKALYSLQD